MHLIQDGRLVGDTIGVIVMELRRAFDPVDHRLLIQRLGRLGVNREIRPSSPPSYRRDSAKSRVGAGVPQG